MILVLRHGDDIPVGYLGGALEAAGMDHREVLLQRGDEIPDGNWTGVAVLGGEMGAYDDDRYPWLPAEKAFLADQVAAGTPIIGVCLGCQIMAEVLGGRAFAAPEGSEIGFFQPDLTADGEADPVLRYLDAPVPVFHSDTWMLPPGATLLASSDRYPHAFRSNRVVGIQAHPEADAGIVSGWARHDGAARRLVEAGVTSDALVAAISDGAESQEKVALALFGAWIEVAVAARG